MQRQRNIEANQGRSCLSVLLLGFGLDSQSAGRRGGDMWIGLCARVFVHKVMGAQMSAHYKDRQALTAEHR